MSCAGQYYRSALNVPKLGSSILMQWGGDYVLAVVEKVEVKDMGYGGMKVMVPSGRIRIQEKSHPGVFGSGWTAENFDWRNVNWVYCPLD